MSQIELPQGPGDRINEAFVSGRAPLEAPPEGFATQACCDPAEKMRCRVVRFLIGFKKFFFFKNLGCYIKVPILNVGSIKTLTHQQGKQNVPMSHVLQGSL